MLELSINEDLIVVSVWVECEGWKGWIVRSQHAEARRRLTSCSRVSRAKGLLINESVEATWLVSLRIESSRTKLYCRCGCCGPRRRGACACDAVLSERERICGPATSLAPLSLVGGSSKRSVGKLLRRPFVVVVVPVSFGRRRLDPFSRSEVRARADAHHISFRTA